MLAYPIDTGQADLTNSLQHNRNSCPYNNNDPGNNSGIYANRILIYGKFSSEIIM